MLLRQSRMLLRQCCFDIVAGVDGALGVNEDVVQAVHGPVRSISA